MFKADFPTFLDKCFTVVALEGGNQYTSQTIGKYGNWAN